MPTLRERYEKEIKPKLLAEAGLTNGLAVVRPVKVVVNMGIGAIRDDAKLFASYKEDLRLITGQQPVVRLAKKAEAGFKIRAGDSIGLMVTLRGGRMWNFLDRLLNVVLPRVRDFHGVSEKSFDGRGNYNLGILEHTVFPEINPNKVDRVKCLGINICTNAGSDNEARKLFAALGLPFAKK